MCPVDPAPDCPASGPAGHPTALFAHRQYKEKQFSVRARRGTALEEALFLVRIRIHFYSKPVTWLFGPLHARAMRPRASKCVNRACEVMLVVW
jgi:hypothetical protein